METRKYQVCVRCVMDTSDPDITFSEDGICNHCDHFDQNAHKIWFQGADGANRLEELIQRIKHQNRNKDFDCIMGLSGGLDSSYLALLLQEFNLRVLAVHVDAGWNTELAVSNIEAIVNHCNFELVTHVVDWHDMRELQLSYLQSGISNQDVPQDHVFFAVLHKQAMQRDCKYFMSGGNVATEFTLPIGWHGDAMDRINLRSIHRRFGRAPLRSYETISFWDWRIGFRLRGFQQVRPLNFVPYSTEMAVKALAEIGWRQYERKHGESHFTKFFQNYFLPKRFGYDKRRPHFSSRIHSGDMTRVEAEELLMRPLYEEKELEEDLKFVCNKLGITSGDMDEYLNLPLHTYRDYKNWDKRGQWLEMLFKIVKPLVRKA